MNSRFRKRAFFLAAALLATVFVSTSALCAAPKEDARAWVERVIAAAGGRSALERVRSIVYQGRIEALMPEARGTETISLQRPRHLRAVIHYSGLTEVRILNGERAWNSSGGPFQRATGPRYLGIVYMYQHLDLPMALLDESGPITLRHETWQGKSYPVLALDKGDGPPLRIFVDPATALIKRVVGIFEIGGEQTRLAVDYADYRKVDGIALPFRMVNYAGGMKIAEAAFDRVRVNVPLPAALFQP